MKRKTIILLISILFISLNADTNFSIRKNIQIHGFISQGFFASRNNVFLSPNSRSGSFEYRNIGLNFQTNISNRLRVGIQLLSRDMGNLGNNKLKVDWAYGNFQVHDMFNISAGRIKNQLGFYSEVQDIDFLTPWASLPYYIYDKGLRTITTSTDGFNVSGNVKLGKAGDIDYSFSVGVIGLGMNSDIKEYGESIGQTFTKTSVSNVHVPKISYNTPIRGLRFNFALFNANNFRYDSVAVNSNGLQLFADYVQDIYWYYAGIQYQGFFFDIVAEYHHKYVEGKAYTKPFYHPILADTVYSEAKPNSTRRAGGYIGYNIKPTDYFHTGGYLQLYWKDLLTKHNLDDPTRVSHDGALTLTFNLKSSLTIKLEGHIVYGSALLGKNLDQDSNLYRDWWQYGIIKLSYNF